MNIEMTANCQYCCIDNEKVYTFVPFFDWDNSNPCDHCAFRGSYEPLKQTEECISIPCNGLNRADKKDGYWVLCDNVSPDFVHHVLFAQKS